MKKRDCVADIVSIIKNMVELDASVASRFESEIRNRYGGRYIHIRQRAILTYDEVDAMQRRKMSVKQIADEKGVSRSMVYRVIENFQKARRGNTQTFIQSTVE